MGLPGIGVRGLAPLVRFALQPRATRFERDLARPDAAQGQLLREILLGVAGTEYGVRHGLDPREGYEGFRAKLPPVTYEQLTPWIARQMAEGGRVLVPDHVRAWRPTSGSSGAVKHIPYPHALVRSFDRMFRLWLYDLLTHGPRLETGRTWIGTSPTLGSLDRAPRFAEPMDDRDYVTGWVRTLLERFLVLAPEVGCLRDADAFRHVAALFLLAGDPEVVSVWNPSFLTVLLRYVEASRETLAHDLAAGRVAREGIELRFGRPSPDRMAALWGDPVDWRGLLPGLKLISCWADERAGAGADRLRHLFPGVVVQAKGLLATEAPLTLPWTPAGGFVPLVREVFFEFETASGGVLRLEELTLGETYTLLVTQQGGLCRYRLGDRVRVSHVYRRTPCLVFVGREGSVSDLVGEKLHEEFVKAALRRLAAPGSNFQTLVPERTADGGWRYTLVLDRLEGSRAAAARQLDALLQEAHRYREARLLGQLGPPRVHVAADAEDRFLDHFTARGMRLGDIKHRYLVSDGAADALLLDGAR